MGIKTIELPQTTGRIKSDQNLYDVIVGKRLRHYNDPTLNEHILNAVAIETQRGIRLAKEKTSKKIDLAVALAMALQGASDNAYLYEKRVRIIKDPFYMWPPPENYDYTKHFGWQPPGKVNKKPHPPGVTWETCKRSGNGCLACLEEQEALGLLDDKDEPESMGYISYMENQKQRELLKFDRAVKAAKVIENFNLNVKRSKKNV
jgi:hypothetical protein